MDKTDTDLTATAPSEGGERIAKRLARAGLCSRRDAERWIAEGRVAVNSQTLTTPACVVRPGDIVQVDGKVIPEPEPARLWRYYKPAGLVTSARDEKGRETVFDNLPPELPRVVSIGRLDLTTEGLLLLTNDGELARFLELPATGWTRRYRVRVFGEVEEIKLAALAKGPTIDGVKYGPIEAVLDRIQGRNAWLTVSLKEGKNREIRKVMESLGLVVNRLIRVAYGPFQLGKLEDGAVEEVPKRIVREQIANYFTGDAVVGEGESNTKLRAKARAEAATQSALPPKPALPSEIRSRSGARVAVARKADSPQAAPARAPRSATKRLEAQAAWGAEDAKPASRRTDAPRRADGKPGFAKPAAKRGEEAAARPERPARGRTLSLDDAKAKPTRSGGKPDHRSGDARDASDARPRKSFEKRPDDHRASDRRTDDRKPDGGKPFAAKPAGKPAAKPVEAGAPAGVKTRDGRTDRQRVERPRKPSAHKDGAGKSGPSKGGPSKSGLGKSGQGKSGPNKGGPGADRRR
ncbi:pseudouridine synthase [Azospirillum griseum]|uniref:Pseudouridine synthase n=1 Tax=Azospirillum griseum TaxID=2496639 RepID=A0A431VFR7_9PROT|nr:pseudouridine synthase [Azospirillum griseum]RTR19201.1 pseudouridine synthase [Azospirillum griseum]